jgi:hypothetical protein
MRVVTVRDAALGIPGTVRARAKRFGFSKLDSNDGVYNTFFDGYILRAVVSKLLVVVYIVAPPDNWFVASSFYRGYFFNYTDTPLNRLPRWEYSLPGWLRIPVSPDVPTADRPSVESAALDTTRMKRYQVTGAGTLTPAWYTVTGELRSDGPNGVVGPYITRNSFFTNAYDEGETANGWRQAGAVLTYATAGATSTTDMDPAADVDSPSASRSNAMVIQVDDANFDADFTSNWDTLCGGAHNIANTPNVFVVKEATPEVVDGAEQPLRYADFAVVYAGRIGAAPTRYTELHQLWEDNDAPTQSDRENIRDGWNGSPAGVAIGRFHTPYEITPSYVLSTVWTTTWSLADSASGGLVPQEHTGDTESEFNLDGTHFAWQWDESEITSYACSVREPVTDEVPAATEVPVTDAPAQLLTVLSCNVRQRTVETSPTPDTFELRYGVVALTTELADGATTETVVTVSDPITSYDDFDFYSVYASAGRCVPVVRQPFVDMSTPMPSWPTEFNGYIDSADVTLHMIYPGGTKIDYVLDGWVPPFPVMRGINTYPSRYTQFQYYPDTVGSESRTVELASSEPFPSTTDLWNRRTVAAYQTGAQRIAAYMGNGRVACLLTDGALINSGTTVSWSLGVVAESTGALVEIRSQVVADLPLESSNWVSVNVIEPERADVDGNVTTEAVLVVAVNSPGAINDVPPYNVAKVEDWLHGRGVGGDFPRSEAQLFDDFNCSSADYPEFHRYVMISRDGGRNWDRVMEDVGAEVYCLGTALRPRTLSL